MSLRLEGKLRPSLIVMLKLLRIFIYALSKGLYEGGGGFRIIADIKKKLLKDLVYFSRN